MASRAYFGSSLHRLVYDSVVLLPFGDEGALAMEEILSVARSRNAALGVTGALYFDGAYFVQVLEGPRAAVEAVFANIRQDPRHGDLRIVEEGPIAARNFAEWHMALVTETDMHRAVLRQPELTEVRPYRAPELVATLRAAALDTAD